MRKLDFMFVSVRPSKTHKGTAEVYPKFVINNRSKDLMIRGSDFYAIWLEEAGSWSTDEQDALYLMDSMLDEFAEEHKSDFDSPIRVMHLCDAESGMIDAWHKYCQKQQRDNFHMLDEKLVFANTPVSKEDYSSHRLSYPLEEGPTDAWDELVSTLYSEREQHKIEWTIGAIVSGDSKTLQKFAVFYGAAGTGKSTILNIVEQLFSGYCSVFDAKALGSSSSSFALEPFHTNPLVAIQHDGDLSRIEDNTRLNSLVSHEKMVVNEKFKSTYSNYFKCFLYLGTNTPVRITDAKSGLIRRLIDISPSGKKLPAKEYKRVMAHIPFELGHIASKCLNVYLSDTDAYDDYVPISMMGASNDFFNFILYKWDKFETTDSITLKEVWPMYNEYCTMAKVVHPLSLRAFKEELKNYFNVYYDRKLMPDGSRPWNVYEGFKKDILLGSEEVNESKPKVEEPKYDGWINLKVQHSLLDDILADCPAMYPHEDGSGRLESDWDHNKKILADLDTSLVHHVRPPLYLVVIDFDMVDETGNKSLELNLREANKWPKTYAEVSKSGCGVHLHYIYSGDPTQLSCKYNDKIEVKVFTGKSSLRRKVSLCNDIPVASITGGLPLKEIKKVMNNVKQIQSEQGLIKLIERTIHKEFGHTKPGVSFIKKILDDAYESGMKYDVTNMKDVIIAYAGGSSNHRRECLAMVDKMHFRGKLLAELLVDTELPIAFFDTEVFPNLFIICYKTPEMPFVAQMINPSATEVMDFIAAYRLVGFNCRRYDNHILYARTLGWSNERLFVLSRSIVDSKKGDNNNAFFPSAYDISWLDLYDCSSLKQSLKQFEIDLDIHHQELGFKWDEPVPEEMWSIVAGYCDNDVIATEAVYNARKSDVDARKALAGFSGLKVNATTNSHSTRIIFGDERHPQTSFNYRDLALPVKKCGYSYQRLFGPDGEPLYMGVEDGVPDGCSCLPFFPGYEFKNGKSTYKGFEVGEGGFVYSQPGVYYNVALLDIASMHPHSMLAEELFGEFYTQRLRELIEARIAIKHHDIEKAKGLLDGKLEPYLTSDEQMDKLAKALKIVINSIYGLTAAGFENPFRDPRNIDNIVAKRGALFMINLKEQVEKRGFTVAHIKTDSIKIPDATPDIIQFVMDYGREYGYTFELEDTYQKMCLVNKAVYICKDGKGNWEATGAEFQVPYVFKSLFTKEPIEFKDVCIAKSVQTAIYLDYNEGLPEDEHNYSFVGKVGLFTPVRNGCGGGELLREDNKGGYSSVTGSKGYRWLESEQIAAAGGMSIVDSGYFMSLVDSAADEIRKYADLEEFCQ